MTDIEHPSIRYSGARERVGAPLLLLLVQFPAVCFTLTLLTDVLYRQTENLMWHDFSSWLLFAGLIFGGLAVLTGIVDMVMMPVLRRSRAFWPTPCAAGGDAARRHQQPRACRRRMDGHRSLGPCPVRADLRRHGGDELGRPLAAIPPRPGVVS